MKEKNSKDLSSVIVELLKRGLNKEAEKIAKILYEEFHDDVEVFLLLGIALMNGKKYDKCRRVVSRALEKFPEEWRLCELMGHVLGHLNRLAEAEKHYTAAIEKAFEADKGEKAMLHFYLGECLWGQSHRNEAIERWKKALETDPDCEEAAEALKHNINEYGEPKAPNPLFDDLYHFQGIHLKRYYALVEREEFIQEAEMRSVIEIIMNEWNKFIPPRSQEIVMLQMETEFPKFTIV